MSKINIAVWWVKDYETGTRETLGGLERWTRDLVIELVKRGHDVHVYQRSKKTFHADYYGAKLFGLQCSKNFLGNITFYNKLRRKTNLNDRIIFISQDLIWGSHFNRSIAVNHGVWWSSRQSKLKRLALEVFNNRYIINTQHTICVDSNYINWVIENVKDSHKLLPKLRYIPNYYDSTQFVFNKRLISDKINILFPRRIMGNSLDDEPRGAKDCMLAISNIIKSGYEVKAIFLGEGNLVDDLKVLAEQLKIVDCVEFTTAHFDEIQNYYKISEIVVVPSRFSEGTSLSAIEALASNCFVVSSCVGGLQNFPLFPPYGMMIEPTPDRITFGIKNYLDNREEYLNENKSNNSILSRFEITRWKKEVISLINSI